MKSIYDNFTYAGDAKFILLVTFQTNYYDLANTYTLYLEVPLSLYLEYKQREHLPGTMEYTSEYADYVVVDWVIYTIVDAIKSKLVTGTEEELANALLSVAQNHCGIDMNESLLGVQNNTAVTNTTEYHFGSHYLIDAGYTKYPLETLLMGSGECLDLTILAATLFKAAGFETSILFFIGREGGHTTAGIKLQNAPSHSNPNIPDRTYEGYWVAEATIYGRYIYNGLDMGPRVGDDTPLLNELVFSTLITV